MLGCSVKLGATGDVWTPPVIDDPTPAAASELDGADADTQASDAQSGVAQPAQGSDAQSQLDSGTSAPQGQPDASSPANPGDGAAPATRLDASQADASSTDADRTDAAASDASNPALQDAGTDAAEAGCSLRGTFSAEVNFDVQWKGTTLSGVIPVLAAGTGRIRVIVRMDSDDMGGPASSRLRACMGELPDFAASWLIGEVYSGYIPNSAWDKPAMPQWDLSWSYACRQPGCALSSSPIVVTLGARATAQDVWPGRKGPIEQIVSVDHDDDAMQGITFLTRGPDEFAPNGKAYDPPPVTWTLDARAVKLGLAFQIQASVQAALTTCDSFSGSISNARVEARALTCTARKNQQNAETPCTKSQAEFMDENLPNWTVTGGTVRARRVSPNADCKAVRAAWE